MRYRRRSGRTNSPTFTKSNYSNSLTEKKLSRWAGMSLRVKATVFRRLIREPVKCFPRDHLLHLSRKSLLAGSLALAPESGFGQGASIHGTIPAVHRGVGYSMISQTPINRSFSRFSRFPFTLSAQLPLEDISGAQTRGPGTRNHTCRALSSDVNSRRARRASSPLP